MRGRASSCRAAIVAATFLLHASLLSVSLLQVRAASCGTRLMVSETSVRGDMYEAPAVHVFEARDGSSNGTYMLVGQDRNSNGNPEGALLFEWDAEGQDWSASPVQEVGTGSPRDFVTWEDGGDLYVAMANHRECTSTCTYMTNSAVYLWDGEAGRVSASAPVATFPTKGAQSVATWLDGATGSRYLAATDYFDGTDRTHNSIVYAIQDLLDAYVAGNTPAPVATFPTIGAMDLATWRDEATGIQYLAVANFYDGNDYTQDSAVYAVQDLLDASIAGTTPAPVATFPTIGAHGLATWRDAATGSQYLAVENFRDNNGVTVQDSAVYTVQDLTDAYVAGTMPSPVATFPTRGAHGLATWRDKAMGTQYLAVGNYRDGDQYTLDSAVYAVEELLEAHMAGITPTPVLTISHNGARVVVPAFMPLEAGGPATVPYLIVAGGPDFQQLSTGVVTYALSAPWPPCSTPAPSACPTPQSCETSSSNMVSSEGASGTTGTTEQAETVFVVRAGASFVSEAGSTVDIGV